MTVLIANQNQDIIREIYPKVKFTEITKNTCTFYVSQSTFQQIYAEVKHRGINPFALMTW